MGWYHRLRYYYVHVHVLYMLNAFPNAHTCEFCELPDLTLASIKDSSNSYFPAQATVTLQLLYSTQTDQSWCLIVNNQGPKNES